MDFSAAPISLVKVLPCLLLGWISVQYVPSKKYIITSIKLLNYSITLLGLSLRTFDDPFWLEVSRATSERCFSKRALLYPRRVYRDLLVRMFIRTFVCVFVRSFVRVPTASPLYRLHFLTDCHETSHTCSQTSTLVRV